MTADISQRKKQLRSELRARRRHYAMTLPREERALVFHRPPAPLLRLVPEGATIGLYRAEPGEAPAASYARFFMENGHPIALPRVTTLDRPMEFRKHTDPFEESDLEDGPMGLRQPGLDAPIVEPEVLFMPLVGFTERGERLGQGGGYYDRWLAAHPATIAIGMAWDVQEVEELPLEDHDIPLSAIVTPSRILGPFDA
ncbi:5-formyltetrahydrofolate cyclo-ligase [Altererythrobacter atlanticus]|uniref:5-formyltetrahydrofolate cyclo-ligase n=1 Tax=Croceibacterium atlanticum TaxID=1267766 RepID=A0A0F7KRP2_9SPHN|nr:5-formyltetrahydrofolate cyclo-ligase [Croceibacterium atlanticum]AKH41415.1 5-formyltetrahydrofolate cyclo-ligase family protein [Croceibacterium atlanticum]MBB5732877.1 5-formyltetrahydrofolate cyclo-ligase [Croceibacterium atlanticum]